MSDFEPPPPPPRNGNKNTENHTADSNTEAASLKRKEAPSTEEDTSRNVAARGSSESTDDTEPAICAICQDALLDCRRPMRMTSPCQHCFHESCFWDYRSRQLDVDSLNDCTSRCPMCRQEVVTFERSVEKDVASDIEVDVEIMSDSWKKAVIIKRLLSILDNENVSDNIVASTLKELHAMLHNDAQARSSFGWDGGIPILERTMVLFHDRDAVQLGACQLLGLLAKEDAAAKNCIIRCDCVISMVNAILSHNTDAEALLESLSLMVTDLWSRDFGADSTVATSIEGCVRVCFAVLLRDDPERVDLNVYRLLCLLVSGNTGEATKLVEGPVEKSKIFLAVIEKYPSNANVLCSAFGGLQVLLEEHKKCLNSDADVNAKLIQAVLSTIRNLPDNFRVHYQACELLGHLVLGDRTENVRLALTTPNGLATLLSIAENDRIAASMEFLADLRVSAFHVLSLCLDIFLCQGTLLGRLIQTSVASLKTHITSRALVWEVCVLLTNLARDVEYAPTAIIDVNGVDAILDVMRRHQSETGIQIVTLAALRALSSREDGVPESMVEDIVANCLGAMMGHHGNETIQTEAIALLGKLASYSEISKKKAQSAIVQAGGINVLLSSMSRRHSNTVIQRTALTTLTWIFESDPCNATDAESLVQACHAAMKYHRNDRMVHRKACGLLSSLVSDDSSLRVRSAVFDTGTVSFVLSAMRTYPLATGIQLCGLNVLINLMDGFRDVDQSKLSMLPASSVDSVMSAMTNHERNPQILEAAFEALSGMAGIDDFRPNIKFVKDRISAFATAALSRDESEGLHKEARSLLKVIESI